MRTHKGLTRGTVLHAGRRKPAYRDTATGQVYIDRGLWAVVLGKPWGEHTKTARSFEPDEPQPSST